MSAMALPVTALLNVAPYKGVRVYRQTTAASVTYEKRQTFPTGVFDFGLPIESEHSNALDWITLSRDVLPNATPLTPEERVSINEFFWAHFD